MAHLVALGPADPGIQDQTPFNDRTTLDHLITTLVQYSDPHFKFGGGKLV